MRRGRAKKICIIDLLAVLCGQEASVWQIFYVARKGGEKCVGCASELNPHRKSS